MWDGLAQLIQIVIALALSLVGIEYRAEEEPREDSQEASIQRLIQPASYSFDASPFAADAKCLIEADLEPGIPLLVVAKASDAIT